MKRTFKDLRKKVREYGILSLDLEATSKDTREADLELIAMAAGKGTATVTVVVPPTLEAVSFVQEHLAVPGLRIVGHNIIRYDLEVLHNLDIFKIEDIKAKIIDTLPLSWLYREEIPHGLKQMVKRFFDYDMVTYAGAYLHSPALNMIRQTEKVIGDLTKHLGKVTAQINKQAREEKRRLGKELKEKFVGKRKKVDRIARKEYQVRIDNDILKRFGPSIVATAEEKIRKRIRILETEIRHLECDAENQKREYAADDARQTLRLYYYLRRYLHGKNLGRWADMEVRAQFPSASMELSGIHVDPEQLDEMDKIFVPLMDEFEASMFDMAKMEFNPDSPAQVSNLLYDILGFPDIGGERSTDARTLMRLKHPLPQAILNFKSLRKLRSDFVTKLRDRSLRNKERRIYARFNPIGARKTGRASCSNPNLQQIPSRKKPQEYDKRIQALGPRIRKAFCAPKHRKILSVDLSQIELRLIAHVTGDANLMKVYIEQQEHGGIVYYTGDTHRMTRVHVSNLIGYDIGRKLAKNLNFGLMYGMSAVGFAIYAGLFKPNGEYDVATADKYITAFMNLYSGIPEFLDILADQWHGGTTGFPCRSFGMLSGRKRHFQERFVAPGKILNSIIQGSAADLLKIINWEIYENVIKNPAFRGTKFILQVHDEIALEVDEKKADDIGILVKYLMELSWFRITVPILASAKICNDWGAKDDDDIPEIGHMPPKETGIKPCVAMLDDDQRKWASKHLLTGFEQFDETLEETSGFIPVAEYDERNE